ncbi:segregation/condensation protein A [Streptomyces sp. Root1310]|uniref:segregation and condensation protein A n=1 Tax=Streptomyces sp. Root1310 TaxID=1736452 RepID=UPI0007C70F87|nr:segregation/condensation protein A [Streptomyces sp. Root1310]
MTSNDAPVPGPGAAAGRRRALGRGPGTAPVPTEPDPGAAAPDPAPDPVAPDPAPDPVGPDPVGPDFAEPDPVRPDQAAPDRVEPDLGEPESLGSEPVGPEPVGPEESVDLESAGPESVGPEESVDLGSVGSESAGRESAGPESVWPESVGPESAGPDSVDLGSVGSESADPESMGLGFVASAGGSGAGGAESVGSGPGSEGQEASDGVFKVRLANFEGPFDLLLQLISKHKLDVTEVALSKVTDEFMAHIRAMGPDWDLDQTTEFLVVAATLLDLKAARLLPAAEVEDEADLALLEARDLLFARLLQYRAYKRVADIFTHRLESEARRYPRTVGLEPHHAELLPEVVISIGPEGFARLAVKAMQPRAKPQVYVDHIHAPLVSVQEQAGIVVTRLRELGETSFRTLVADTEDTLTVVARFLALLELYREKAVALDQETALGELLVRWTGGDGDTQPLVTDEFDRPPEEPEKETKT